MKSGIYIILNLLNNKRYIGSAVNLTMRLRTHVSNLKLNKHPNKHLQSAFNLGNEFKLFPIEYCEKENLLKREKIWINYFQSFDNKFGYNKRKEPNSNLGLGGYKQSSEWIKKRTSKLRGRKQTKEAIENNRLARLGKRLSENHKLKLSEIQKGKICSENTKIKIGNANSKPDLWPHEKRSFCKCRECLDKKNLQRREKTKIKAQTKLNKLFEGAKWVALNVN